MIVSYNYIIYMYIYQWFLEENGFFACFGLRLREAWNLQRIRPAQFGMKKAEAFRLLPNHS